ncbi:hypothetical protein MJ3_01912 [Salimicrobium jeotgali]|uniref:Uncharacterized protein n=1 Tax=Salimicrobium jeotgali TaxID=1230341 RepID=K2GQN5_9BACI|nr:hypothetical protein [Salimicrobium jeotgali]EKE32674.1 hypothetical protein MJ3_01912 [Salimicrobium jeotgali]MBM7695340.1 hypothetical protein [Salimicrobium jeotgali]
MRFEIEPIKREGPYRNQKLPGKEVRFTHEPIDGDYDRLYETLSGEVVTYHLGESRNVFSGKDKYTKTFRRR